MKLLRNNLQTLLLVFHAVCLGAVSGFQQNALSLRSSPSPLTISGGKAGRCPSILYLNTPPQYDDDEFDSSPFGDSTDKSPLPTQGIPKLKFPTPSFTLPEIDFKEVLKRIAALVATVVAFVAIQKLGLIVSDVLTPELSAEEVRDFRL